MRTRWTSPRAATFWSPPSSWSSPSASPTHGAIVIPVGGVTISLSGLAVAALVGILLNAVLPGKDYEFGTNEQGDTSVNFGTRAE